MALVALWGFHAIYSTAQGPIEGSLAVGQLKDTNAGYVAARAASQGMIPKAVNFGAVILMLLLWLPVVLRQLFRGSLQNMALMGLLGAVTMLTTGCMGPVKLEKFEDIKPNETAFMIPLEGESKGGQAKFDSVQFLEAKKVAAKRIDIPQRQRDTGRWMGDFEWIPTVLVIKVDRTAITREWKDDKALKMESRDSINFKFGITITAHIDEPDASTYLYFYRGQQSLADILDHNVMGYVLAGLSNKFGNMILSEVQVKKQDVLDQVETDTKTFFKAKGITIDYLGSAGGIEFEDDSIQSSINSKFTAENDLKVAEGQKAAQNIRNAQRVQAAEAAAKEAALLSANAEAYKFKTQLDIEKMKAEAMLEFSKRIVPGVLPANILPQNSQMLFGLDSPVSAQSKK